MSSSDLQVYLSDHLAGSRIALEMLEFLQGNAADQPLREIAAQLHVEISEDRDVLERLMVELGSTPSAVKDASAWLMEKFGRLKLGAVGDSEAQLPQLETVELICLGILGKVALWDAMIAASQADPKLAVLDYLPLRISAQDQHDRLEAHRLRLAVATLCGNGKPS
jgi:hypothetical protein